MDEEKMMKLKDAIEESIDVYNNCTTGSPEREREAKNLKMLIDALHEMYTADNDEEDKRERRRIEEEKNNKNAVIEEKKATRDMKEKIHDICMLLLKGGIATIGQLILMSVLLEFEEKGTVRSKVAKDFKILNPLNWIR